MSPEMRFADINVISGLNTLRKLFAIVENGSSSPGIEDKVRIDIEIIRDTLLMRRWHRLQSSATQMTLTGCGRGFEEACTSIVPGFEDCTSYHRINTLRLGHLTCLAQGEADSFLETVNSAGGAACTRNDIVASDAVGLQVEGSTLCIRHKGTQIDTEHIAEIKSRSIRSKLGPDVWQHLWLSGVRKLFLGKHNYGGFLECNMGLSDKSTAILEWEKTSTETIIRFTQVLEDVFHRSLALVRSGQCEGSLLALVFGGRERTLTLHRRTEDNHMLPEGLEVLLEERA